jgi:hypothetical protein
MAFQHLKNLQLGSALCGTEIKLNGTAQKLFHRLTG